MLNSYTSFVRISAFIIAYTHSFVLFGTNIHCREQIIHNSKGPAFLVSCTKDECVGVESTPKFVCNYSQSSLSVQSWLCFRDCLLSQSRTAVHSSEVIGQLTDIIHSVPRVVSTPQISNLIQTPIFRSGWVVGITPYAQFSPIPSPLLSIFSKNDFEV